jgi:hypothetical protein
LRDLLLLKRAGDHAVRLAAAVEDGVRDRAHQADVAAAVDQAEAALGQQAAEGRGGVGERRIDTGVGAAVDRDRRWL